MPIGQYAVPEIQRGVLSIKLFVFARPTTCAIFSTCVVVISRLEDGWKWDGHHIGHEVL